MTTESQELKSRVEAKQRRLEAEMLELKANASESTRERIEAIERQLTEMRGAIRDGYDNLKKDTIAKLNALLADDSENNE